jgi:hypothetical protein
MSDTNIPEIERLIREKNYLAAYLLVKDSSISKPAALEYTGKIVSGIIADMESGPARKDRTLYFRSLLLFIFEDYPALSRIYSRQIRLIEESKPSFDILSTLRMLIDTAKDKDELKAKIEETFGNIKEKIEDTTQEVKDGTAQKKIEDFFYVAGEGIKEGLKQFSAFMQNLNKEQEDRNDQDDIKQNAEPVEDNEDREEGGKDGREKPE